MSDDVKVPDASGPATEPTEGRDAIDWFDRE